MHRPSEDITKQAAMIATHYPRFVEWLGAWKEQELNSLPMQIENVQRAQGRCVVLKELHEFLSKAPELAATSRPRTP